MSLRALSTSPTTVSSVSKNNADVPGVTFCFTSSMNSSLIPMSMIDVLQAPSAAPTAAPRSGTRKINPYRTGEVSSGSSSSVSQYQFPSSPRQQLERHGGLGLAGPQGQRRSRGGTHC